MGGVATVVQDHVGLPIVGRDASVDAPPEILLRLPPPRKYRETYPKHQHNQFVSLYNNNNNNNNSVEPATNPPGEEKKKETQRFSLLLIEASTEIQVESRGKSHQSFKEW